MHRFNFKKGLVFTEIDNRWQLQRRLVSGNLQFENEQGQIKTLTDGELNRLYLRGEWVVDIHTIGSAKDVIHLATPSDLSAFPEKWQKRARRSLHYIQQIDPEKNRYNVDLWKELILVAAAEINDPKPPTPITVQTWWRRYRTTKSITKLIPWNSKNRERLRDSRYAIFEDVISKVYLSAQKRSKTDVVRAVEAQILALNAHRSEEEKIPKLARSAIYRWINDLQQDIVDGARLGAEAARSKYRVAMDGLKVDGILERIEIDHSPLDLIVIDHITQLPLGRPWITLAIDKFSRMIVGFYVCFNAPSSHSVLQCLKRSILPKDDWLARFPDIKGTWPAQGIPQLIAVDNGMDLHSDAFEKACQELGIQILYCPAARPENKGSIERFFRTMTEGLIHKLPGTVFSNIDQRGDYKSEEQAAIDMETLLYLLTKWIVDVYSVSIHRGIKSTPFIKWVDSAQKSMIDLPVYPQQLDVIIGIPAKRTVFHYGIELEGLHYNNRTLQELRRRAGENLQVQLKFYMDSVAYIHVFNPFQKEYLKVECVHEDYSEDLPRDAHRLVREHARRKLGDSYSILQLHEARQEIEVKISEALKNKKMAKRKLGANLLKHDSEAILNSEDPLQKAQKPIKKALVKPPEDLPSGLDDDLPTFDFRKLPSLDLNSDDEVES
jgi:putative transposase